MKALIAAILLFSVAGAEARADTDSTPVALPEALPEAPPQSDSDSDSGADSLSAVDTEGSVAPTQAVDDAPGPAAIPPDQMPKIALSVTPKAVSVGETITWQLTVDRRAEDSVHLAGGASFGGLEVKSKEKKESPKADGRVREVLTVELIGFEPDDITVPAQKLSVVDAEGRIAEMETDEAAVTVKSLIANEPEPALKEDTGPGETVMEKDYLLLWILGILGGIALTAALTLLGRRLYAMRKPKPGPPPPPPRPAEEIAIEKLESLKRSNLLAEGDIKEFHVRLSEAVREYLGNRYRFEALEMSSEELIVALRRINLTRADYDYILDFLGETDLVKFAKALPTVAESEDLLVQSFALVDRTTPKPANPSEGGTEKSSGGKEGDHA